MTHHVTNSMSAMHTFSMCNQNDENADVYILIVLWDILTLLLYGLDVCLLWGLTKHTQYTIQYMQFMIKHFDIPCVYTIHAIYN